MSKKIISMLLAVTISTICAGTVFETKAYASDNRATTLGAGPMIPGTEDIIAQDTVWKYGVKQPTNLGVAIGVASGLLGMSGGVQIFEKAAANYIASQMGGFMINTVFHLSNTVNIKLDRYKLRGADGKIRYKVYATYYKLNGSVITSQLVQQGYM